jgi:hypothetical protein
MHGITIDSTRRRQNEEASAAALSESGRRLSELNEKLQQLAESQTSSARGQSGPDPGDFR